MNDINNIINDILNAMSFIIEQLCHKADGLLVEIYRTQLNQRGHVIQTRLTSRSQ